jgi:hypothetical protein
MRLARMLLGGWLWTLASGAGWAFEDAPPAALLPELITTVEHEFAIPFSVEDLAQGPDRPTQVQLFVSADRGQNWMLQAMARPEDGSFTFRAPYDGEFWFLLRTVDKRGKVWPEGAPQAEMRVAVMSPAEPAALPGKELRIGDNDARAARHSPEKLQSLLASAPGGVAAGFPVDRLPAGTQPKMVNSHTFEIDYDVDTAGPSAAGRVELWWTGDGGRSWNRYDTDDDCKSPMLVRVDRDGLYGFWMTIDSLGGLRGTTPREGDAPQVWVGVDTLPPSARLTTAEPTGAQGEGLIVRWEASDALLAARPVTLAYSTRAAGPWTEIVTDIDNKGQYTYQAPQRLPAEIFLRLQVKDEAGNVQVFDTTEAFKVSQPTTVSRPTRTEGDWARGPRWYQVLR